MSKEVTKRDTVTLEKFGDMMDTTPIDSKDFLIAKLLLMQGLSTWVQEEKARAGEIRGSLDCNKVAEKEGSLEIIPFQVYKTWVTVAKAGNEFISQQPLTPANYSKPREEVIDGKECLNFETLNYYCVLPEEIKKGMFMPYVVSFRSTSYTAGKTLETHRALLQEFGKPLPFKTFNLGSAARENDKGKFYVYTITESRDTTDSELEAVKHWFNIVKQGGAKVDESDVEEKTVNATAKTTTTPGRVNAGEKF